METADGPTFAIITLNVVWHIRPTCGYDRQPVVHARVEVAAATLDCFAKIILYSR